MVIFLFKWYALDLLGYAFPFQLPFQDWFSRMLHVKKMWHASFIKIP